MQKLQVKTSTGWQWFGGAASYGAVCTVPTKDLAQPMHGDPKQELTRMRRKYARGARKREFRLAD